MKNDMNVYDRKLMHSIKMIRNSFIDGNEGQAWYNYGRAQMALEIAAEDQYITYTDKYNIENTIWEYFMRCEDDQRVKVI